MDQLSGLVDAIVFTSEDTGYTVAKMKQPREREPLTIVGAMPSLSPGETIHCKGTWKHHPKHGRQFSVEAFQVEKPTDVYGIQKYLESGLIKGIGPAYAERIVNTFGSDTLSVIDETPSRLEEVPGIGEKRVEMIAESWDKQKAIRHVMIFLQSHHVRPSLAQKIYKTYGDDSIKRVQENPYALAKQIFGVGFKTADMLAQNLGVPKDSPLRIKAGIEHFLWEMSSNGHVCYPLKTFIPQAAELLEVDEPQVAKEVTALTEEGTTVTSDLPGKEQPEPYIWVKPLYLAELGIAREIERIQSAPCRIRPIIVDKALSWASDKLRIRFAKEQKEAIAQSLEQKIHIITGGPGTGKSTITRAILSITSKVTDKVVLAAPTGRAAKRMTEITGRKAFTIHSLLEFDFHAKGFKRDKDNPIGARLLIVDEASMIDTHLTYSLLKAIPDDTRVIFIGDIDQLPSVGPGNVLKDMIESKALSMTRLKWIFRQGKNSRIVSNAHRINAGYFPSLENEEGSDFAFLPLETPEEILAKIVELVKDRIPQEKLFNPIDDIQVLSPMKRGIIGTDHLNHVLQNALNPQHHRLVRMGRTFQLHDKVMQMRNNYDKKVFNGDIGRISSIDLESEQLTVSFDDRAVEYEFCDIDELMLAYAVSIHKYQGSECPCVIIPVHTSHFKLLFRNLLYTGITRGKKLVVLVGNKKAVAIAVNTDNVTSRHTGLRSMLARTTMKSS